MKKKEGTSKAQGFILFFNLHFQVWGLEPKVAPVFGFHFLCHNKGKTMQNDTGAGSWD